MRRRAAAIIITVAFIILSVPLAPRCAEVEKTLPFSRVVMPELLIGVGTRAVAMGGAAAAISDDLSSLYWNPAGLSRVRHVEVEFTHNSWIQNISQETFLCGLPVNFIFPGLPDGMVALGINYFGLGSIEKTSESPDGGIIIDNEVLDLFMLGGQAGFGLTLTSALALGGALKFAYQNLGVKSSLGIGLDMGLQYQGIEKVNLGIVLRNMGLSLDGYALPQGLRLGGAYNMEPAPRHKLIAGADIEVSLLTLRSGLYHLGVEYEYSETAALRLGYQFSDDDASGGGSSLSMGMGIKIGGWKFGYTLASQGELGNAHRISAGLNFHGLAKFISEKKASAKAAGKPLAPVLSGRQRKVKTYSASRDTSIIREETVMQKLLQDNIRIKIRVHAYSAGGIRVVVFRVHRTSGPRIIRWELYLEDQLGKPLRKQTGRSMPKVLRWDGKTEAGAVVKYAKGLRYRIVLWDVKGEQETRTGKLLASQYQDQLGKGDAEKRVAGKKNFQPVFFDTDRAGITALGARRITEAAKFIRQHPRAKIVVEGFCDSAEKANQATTLSKARAQAVARYLTAYHNISLSRILVRGLGVKKSKDSEPGYKNQCAIITVEGR